jgi:hypothetical protein
MTFITDNCIDLHHNIMMEFYSQKDSFLMEIFIKQGASSPELISMIQCRNFLRVSRMSVVATGCGSRILPRMYNGGAPESDETNQWPIQPRPPKGAWTIRKKYMGFTVTSQTTLALRHRLEKWKEESPRTPWKYHEPADRLYFQHSQGTTSYHRILGTSRHSRNRGFIPAGEIDEAFLETVDTMIGGKANTTYMSGYREREQSSASIRHDTFEHYLETQQHYAWLFRHTLCYIKFQDLVDAIKEGRDIAMSGGSHQKKLGTASWRIMVDTNDAEQWTGLHVTPGIKDDQYAFRSSIGGVYAMAVAIELICKFFHISNRSVSFGSDREAALYYVFDRNKKQQQQQILLI